MKTPVLSKTIVTTLLAATLGLFATGCQSAKNCCPTTATTAASIPPVVEVKPALPTIRIKAGVFTPVKDSSGNVWLADQGFADGDTIERPELKIEGTTDQAIYQSERYAMSKFTQALPNGKYVVKLHFAETFEGITDKGQRVFSFNVEGKEFKDFDPFAKAGGFARAYVETVSVDIADGALDITFTSNVENPEINGIEILPAS